MKVTRVLLGLLLAAACGIGCGRQGDATAPEPASPAASNPATTAPKPPSNPLVGTWWALSRGAPTFALRIDLDGPSSADPGMARGSAVCFDWAGSEASARLFRASHPVAVVASVEGGRLAISGPVPQVDAKGRPTGRRGHWMIGAPLEVEGGRPYRLTGRLVRDDGDPTAGDPSGSDVAVDLERDFKAWSP